jgi:hypothetical protein
VEVGCIDTEVGEDFASTLQKHCTLLHGAIISKEDHGQQ